VGPRVRGRCAAPRAVCRGRSAGGCGVVEVAGRSVLGRRRRANAPGGRRYAHKVLVTAEEEATLTRLAAQAGVSVPRLLVEAATSPVVGETASVRREAMVELFGLIRVVSGIAGNLNQVARVANATGEVPVAERVLRERIRELIPHIERAVDDLADPVNRRPLGPPPGRPGH
jgi:hypothetical protein